jgi:hypothetical protein
LSVVKLNLLSVVKILIGSVSLRSCKR